MRALTVLYDVHCELCSRCRAWVEKEPKILAVEFVPAGSPEARARFPLLEGEKAELTVVDDEGGVYRGSDAYVIVLYAMAEWREWSIRLAEPGWRPVARWLFRKVTENRGAISRWLS
jgi:predicted DCC family thiol-disulfide oxidoreductase YuxK